MKPASLLLASLFAATASLQAAAIISWGTPQNVTAVTDISTTGTLVTAANLGTTTSYTINGVTFTGNTTLWTGTGNANFTGYVAHAVGGDYGNALSTGRYTNGGTTATLVLSGLTIGTTYQLQIWFNDLRDGTPDIVRYNMGGSTVDLTTDTDGGTGGTDLSQYALGTFTATATSENLTATTVSGGGGPTLNMFQVRAIPETSSALLGGLGLLALLRRRR